MPYVEAASPTHPSLLDVGHVVDELLGVVNVPNGVWIDETGSIVRPAEPAWPGVQVDRGSRTASMGDDLPERLDRMMELAGRIESDRDAYAVAIRDWAANGASSTYALAADEVVARSGERGERGATAAAHFELAQHFERAGDHATAITHFSNAHELAPDNWTYRRQAWSLEASPIPGPLERFWQGPIDGEKWPYRGDWVTDIAASGPENYYPAFRP